MMKAMDEHVDTSEETFDLEEELDLEDVSMEATTQNHSTVLATPSRKHEVLELQHNALEPPSDDFARARSLREQMGSSSPLMGIFGLYQNIVDLRNDLEWANDAAYRRLHKEPYISWKAFLKNKADHGDYVSVAIVGVLWVYMLAAFAVGGFEFAPLRNNPMLGPTADTLIEAGAVHQPLLEHVGYMRLFSAIFLHAGLIHLLCNSVALWVVGPMVERVYGSWNMLWIFVISGYGGNIASAFFLPQGVSVGASGGILGLVGTMLADIYVNLNILVMVHKSEGKLLNICGSMGWMLVEIVLLLGLGLIPYVDNFAHLGGLAYGFFFGMLFVRQLYTGHNFESPAKGYYFLMGVSRTVYVIVGLFFFMSTFGMLIRGFDGNVLCPWCRYMSCAPMPFWADSEEDLWWRCDPCATASGRLVGDDLELHCPFYGETVDLVVSPELTLHEIEKNLPDYCRAHCDLY